MRSVTTPTQRQAFRCQYAQAITFQDRAGHLKDARQNVPRSWSAASAQRTAGPVASWFTGRRLSSRGAVTKILIDQIRTIAASYVTGELVDYLSRDDMGQVEHGLSRYFGLLR
jgi:hypothetical protein